MNSDKIDIAELEERLRSELMDTRVTTRSAPQLRWADVPEKEKWKMMLGVQLRAVAASLIFWLGIALVVAL